MAALNLWFAPEIFKIPPFTEELPELIVAEPNVNTPVELTFRVLAAPVPLPKVVAPRPE